jgi:hypothetical protein
MKSRHTGFARFFRTVAPAVALLTSLVYQAAANAGEQSIDFGAISTPPPWTFNNIDVNPGCASYSTVNLTLNPTGALHTGTIGGELNLTTSPGGSCYLLWSVDFEPTPNQLIRPKFKVVNVVYAPTGSSWGTRSSFQYAQGFSSSSSESFSEDITGSNSAQESLGFSISDKGGVGSCASGQSSGCFQSIVLPIGITASASSTDSSGLTESFSSMYTLTTGETSTYQILGSNSVDGINHTYDTIFVWLNPVEANYATSSYTLVLGWGSNALDPYLAHTGAPDVIPLSVAELQQCVAGASWSSILDSTDAGRVMRAWDTPWTSGSGALTPSDCQTILNEDKLVSASYNPLNDPRYDLVVDNSGNLVTVPYSPTATPQSVMYTAQASSTSVFGQSLKDTYTVASSLGVSASYYLTAGLTSTSTWTYDTTWSSQVQTGSTNSATFQIYSPSSTKYSGPTTFLVLKDNIYGTYSLWAPPVPVSPSSVNNKSAGSVVRQ